MSPDISTREPEWVNDLDTEINGNNAPSVRVLRTHSSQLTEDSDSEKLDLNTHATLDAAARIGARVVRDLTDDEISWTLHGSVSASHSGAMLDVAVGAMALVPDELAVDIIEQLAVTIVEQREELDAVRAILRTSLALSHGQRLEVRRLREHLSLLNAARRLEGAAR